MPIKKSVIQEIADRASASLLVRVNEAEQELHELLIKAVAKKTPKQVLEAFNQKDNVFNPYIRTTKFIYVNVAGITCRKFYVPQEVPNCTGRGHENLVREDLSESDFIALYDKHEELLSLDAEREKFRCQTMSILEKFNSLEEVASKIPELVKFFPKSGKQIEAGAPELDQFKDAIKNISSTTIN